MSLGASATRSFTASRRANLIAGTVFANILIAGLVSPIKSDAQAFGTILDNASDGLRFYDAHTGALIKTLGSSGGAYGLAVDSAGNIFWDNNAGTIFKATPGDTVSTFVAATSALPLSFDSAGNLWTIKGGNSGMGYFDTGGTYHASSVFNTPFFQTGIHANVQHFTIGSNDHIYFGDSDNTVSEYTLSGTLLSTFGTGAQADLSTDGAGNLFVADFGAVAREYDSSNSLVKTFTNNAQNHIATLASDLNGGLYTADHFNLDYVSSTGAITRLNTSFSGQKILFQSSSVPEPGAIALGAGAFSLGGLALIRRRRRSRK